MPFNQPLLQEMTERLVSLIGPATDEITKLRRWRKGPFQLAVDLETGPQIWMEARWVVNGLIPTGVSVRRYAAGEPRHHGLKAITPDLYDKEAYRLRPEEAQLDALMEFIADCARRAGVLH